MILTLQIRIGGWTGTIEIDESSTAADLHHCIQQAVDFDDDHLYEFYLSNSATSRNRSVVASYEFADTVSLTEIFPLPKGKKLFYLFDFGDDWLFTVSESRTPLFDPVNGLSYPRLVAEKGDPPIQYQDWEE